MENEAYQTIALIIFALSTYDFPFLAWMLDKVAIIMGWIAWIAGRISLHARLAYYEVVQ